MNKRLRRFLDINIAASQWFDRIFLSEDYRRDGNQDFARTIAPNHISPNSKIYDVGGGKEPFLDVTEKRNLKAYVIGIDISSQELDAAPLGAYDEVRQADIATIKGDCDGDIVICRAVLEHVQDTENAISAISSLLKPGGKALIFIPSRNAIYARLNLALPESWKRTILWTLYPSTQKGQGFKSYYHKCTPSNMLIMAKENDLNLVMGYYYFISSYFSFFFPAYICWRIWVVLFRLIAGDQAAETFTFVLEKQSTPGT